MMEPNERRVASESWWWPVATPSGNWDGGDVQVWRASLRQPAERLAELSAHLSADEWERAARFRFPEHGNRFIAGRGLLRELLAAYLDRPAGALRFAQGKHGKPVLAGAEAGAGLCFNLSPSEEGVLYAVARRAVGADLECHGRSVRYEAIIDRICTSGELACFQAQPAERRREAFFGCWTRKEAIAKALGGGLASGLRTLEVCFAKDGQPEGRLRLRDAEGREWSVLSLPLEPGWSGALAGAGAEWRWRGWRLPAAGGGTG